MIYIGYAIFVFGLIRLMVSFINWISHSYLPEQFTLDNKPMVSILIPARNEETNITNLLNDLITIKYRPLEIVVYDDSSTDNTAAIVNEFAAVHHHIRLIEGTSLQVGWLGKNFGCHQLALVSKGDKLLFLDADVRLNSQIIDKMLTYTDNYKLKLLSIFPTQIMPTRGSRLVVPIMNWILLSLLPLPLIRLSGRGSLSAANGQCMFFNAAEYNMILPHELYKSNQVEDIAILREYKKRKIKVATLLGADDIYCKMYSSLQDGIDGFSKNVFQFFGGESFSYAFVCHSYHYSTILFIPF